MFKPNYGADRAARRLMAQARREEKQRKREEKLAQRKATREAEIKNSPDDAGPMSRVLDQNT